MIFLRRLKTAFMWKKTTTLLLAFVVVVLGFKLFIYDASCVTTVLTERENAGIPEKELKALKQAWLLEHQKKNANAGHESHDHMVDEPPNGNAQQVVSPIECLINDNYTVQCLKSSNSDEMVYMPFEFLEKYFEVYGKMKHYDGYDRFEFLQSNVKVVYKPEQPYTYHGAFMNFDSYNVEIRERVKCVSGVYGVPVSTQWDANGYFYPIQISQYGMSHYSKNLFQKPPKRNVYEDGQISSQVRWKATNRYCHYESILDKETDSHVIKFETPETIPLGNGVTMVLGNTVEHELSFDIKFTANGSLSVILDTNEKSKQYTIHYITNSALIDYDGHSSVFYGIGPSTNWRHISRDLVTDIRKGLGMIRRKKNKKIKISIQKVSKIILRGSGLIDNITLATYDHMAHFKDACNWMVANLDMASGGWKMSISRVLDEFEVIKPGWVSAMAQGQGLSMLSRAYYIYKEEQYLEAMAKALLPFSIPSKEGGCRAKFLDKFVWYEEYPTTPSSFVLNGFMYSLIGLYDFKSLLEDKFAISEDNNLPSKTVGVVDIQATYKTVKKLFDDGMVSLKSMLPLYDGGTRTFYDLRHFAFRKPPMIARWDYHTTHLSQLALFATISSDPIFEKYFNSWQGYMNGKVANHN
uniref:heparosan-N-sulfate-glucuronate 5-epimerase n=1 Tax=Phallusia mammillata TaxID=59560 RepID=A0A6F9DD33_9ASCI|nr:D-glucuronyl C5-epimerase [Phallusia mammillata]